MRAARLFRVLLAVLTFLCANLFFLGMAEWAAILFKVQLLPALLAFNVVAVVAVLAATLLFGRVYCSVVCPMGVFQDVVIGISCRFVGRRKAVPPPPGGVRYAALAFSVATVALGFVSLGAIFDGYSLYGRMATQLFKPLYSAVHNLVAAILADHGHPVLFREEIFVRGMGAFALALAGFVGVGMLAWWRGRLFCNTVCPVGAALALVAKRPFVRLSINPEKCVKCGLCARSCPCGALDVRGGKVLDMACVRCLNCLSACRKDALGFSFGIISNVEKGKNAHENA